MQLTKLTLFWFLSLMLIFISCDKKPVEPAPSCSDGIMNNGELGVDCGGPCAPCQTLTTPVIFAVFNGEMTSFSNYSLSYGDTIFLTAQVDSVQLNLMFKNLTQPDESQQLNPIVPSGMPYVVYNETNYTEIDLQYSVVVLTKNESNKLSGLFQLALPHGFNNMDTLKVVNGTFENIPY